LFNFLPQLLVLDALALRHLSRPRSLSGLAASMASVQLKPPSDYRQVVGF